MKYTFKLFFLAFLAFPSMAQEKYTATLDLQKVKKDQVKVVMHTPQIIENEALFVMPVVIPGSYSQKNFGRFISKFKAYDKNGKKLKYIKEDKELFRILDASNLAKIEYWVDDTWDDDNKEAFIFQPGGTNIEKNKNFVINHHGFFGYLEGYKNLPYEITISKPKGFYGASSIELQYLDAEKDQIYAPNYVSLADQPILYSIPDTTCYTVGKSKVCIACYSSTGAINSAFLKKSIVPLSNALEMFFDGELPVKEYHFLFYFAGKDQKELYKNGGFGALEHNKSSFYFLPEIPDTAYLSHIIKDIAAHEFLHILTPLNLHSEEIANFNFKDPDMSKHLWLYEGVTEYFSLLVQLKYGLMDESVFLSKMHGKIKKASQYPLTSFTEMSKNILTKEYKDMYLNVYQKGALIAFLLDIRIQELSKGKLTLAELLKNLANEYGPEKPFKDNELIDAIVHASHPEINSFFTVYVEGEKELPYTEYFNKIGWVYHDGIQDTIFTFGEVYMALNPQKELFVFEAGTNNLGLQKGDIIKEINQYKVTSTNAGKLSEIISSPSEGGTVQVKAMRQAQTISLSASPGKTPVIKKHVLKTSDNLTTEQENFKKDFFYGKE